MYALLAAQELFSVPASKKVKAKYLATAIACIRQIEQPHIREVLTHFFVQRWGNNSIS